MSLLDGSPVLGRLVAAAHPQAWLALFHVGVFGLGHREAVVKIM